MSAFVFEDPSDTGEAKVASVPGPFAQPGRPHRCALSPAVARGTKTDVDHHLLAVFSPRERGDDPREWLDAEVRLQREELVPRQSHRGGERYPRRGVADWRE